MIILNKYYSILFILLFVSLFESKGNNPDALLSIKADSFLLINQLDSAASYYREAGRYQRGLENYQKSDSLFNLGEKAVINSSEKSDLIVLKNIYKDKYYNQYVYGNYINQLENLERAYTISQQLNSPDSYILHNLGSLYTRLGDYESAILLLKEAKETYKEKIKKTSAQNLPEIYDNLALVLNDLSIVYYSTQVFEEAIIILNEAINIPILPAQTQGLLYSTKAEQYASQIKNDSALIYIKKAVNIYDRLLSNRDTIYLQYFWGFQIYAMAGKIWGDQQNFKQATYYFEKAKQIGKVLFGETNRREFAKLFIDYGKLLFKTKKYDLALEQYKAALNSVIGGAPLEDLQNPTEKQLHTENSILEALVEKAKIHQLFYEEDKNQSHLKHALDCLQKAFKVEDLLWKNYEFESSKLTHLSYFRSHTEKAIEIAHQLFTLSKDPLYLNLAFEFAERNKSVILLEGIKQNLTSNLLQKQDSLFQKEKYLNKSLANYTIKIIEARKRADKTTEDHYTKLKQDLNQKLLINSKIIKEQYPFFEQLKVTNYSNKLKTIQEQLITDPNTILLEYFYGEKNIFLFKISKKNNLELFKIPLTNTLKNAIKEFPSLFKRSDIILKAPNKYSTLASQLYDNILSIANLKENTSIILVPDYKLNFIPFEALLTDHYNFTSFKDTPFLIKKHTLKIAYSTTFLLEIEQKQDINKKALVMAPIFEARQRNLDILQHSQKELEHINFSNTQRFIATNASLANFKRHAPSAKLIHLSTHARVDSTNQLPSIEFFDSTLFLPEVYTLDITADLLILSACQTNLGKVEKGEGVMSLSRGFSYVGVKSLISSLWSVNAASTAQLFNNFYTNLSADLSKSEALRKSKLDLINDTDIFDRKKSPFYWAGFVFIGQDGQLEFEERKWLSPELLFSSLLFMCLSIFVFRRFKE